MVSAVSFHNVSRRFGAVRAVDGVTLDIQPGEFFAMLGPSGSGKTTCLRLIAGFEQPDDGHIAIFGERELADCRLNGRRGVSRTADCDRRRIGADGDYTSRSVDERHRAVGVRRDGERSGHAGHRHRVNHRLEGLRPQRDRAVVVERVVGVEPHRERLHVRDAGQVGAAIKQ